MFPEKAEKKALLPQTSEVSLLMAADHCHSNDYWPITARLSRDSESRVVPGLYGSAVLIGCVAKHLPPPASDWPTNFRFSDETGPRILYPG